MVRTTALVLLLAITKFSTALPHIAKKTAAVAQEAVLAPRQTDAPTAGTPWTPAPDCANTVATPGGDDFPKVLRAVKNPPSNYDISSFCSAGLQQSLVAWEVSTEHEATTSTVVVSRTILVAPSTRRPHAVRAPLAIRVPEAVPAPTSAPVLMPREDGSKMMKRDFGDLPEFLEDMNTSVYVLNWLAGACSCIITAALPDTTYTTHTVVDRVYDLKTATTTRTARVVMTAKA